MIKTYKILLFYFLVISSIWPLGSAKASHILGGEITYRCLGNGLFEFTIKVYRDCNGIPWTQTALALQGPHGTTNLPIIPGSPDDISPRCPGSTYLSCNPPSSAMSQNQGSVARYVFRGIVDLSALGPAPPAGYTFNTTQAGNGIPCCRPTIDNSTADNGSQTLLVKMFPYRDPNTNLLLSPAQLCDNSPEFATDPTSFAILNPVDTVFMQSLAFDPDLDSTRFGIDFPLGTSVTAPYAYTAPYTVNNPIPGLMQPPFVSASNIPINQTTGEIVYQPTTQGTFVMVIKVTSYRCNQVVSEVYRDFNLKVIPNAPTSPPVFNPNGPLNGIFTQRPPFIRAPFTLPNGDPSFEGTYYAGDTIESFVNAEDAFPSLLGNPNDPSTWVPVQQSVSVFVRGSQLATNFPGYNNCIQPPCARLQRINDTTLPPNPPQFPATILPYGNGTPAGFGFTGTVQSGVKIVWPTACSNLPRGVANCGFLLSNNKFQINAFDNNCPVEGRNARVVNVNLLNVPALPSVRLNRILVSQNNDSVSVFWHNPFGGHGDVIDTFTIDSLDLRNYSNHSMALQREKSVSRRIRSFKEYRLYRQTLNRANGLPIGTWMLVNTSAILDSAKLVDVSSSLNLSTFDYRYRVGVVSRCDSIEVLSDSLAPLNRNRISGDLRYNNASLIPLAGVPVLLKTLLGNVVMSDTTDSSGYYDMSGYANGNFLLDAAVNYTWGGVTASDALLVTRAFNALVTMDSLSVKAGDVNGNNMMNSSDALLINRRITGLLSTFSAGSFVNNLPSVIARGNALVANLQVLSVGDVNGSYAAQPTAPALVLDTVIAGLGSGLAVVRFTAAGSGVFERGICWGTTPNPTISANSSLAGSGGFGFTQMFSGNLVGNQLHYARAYARTSLGTFYSNEKTFTPPPGQPCTGTTIVTDVNGITYNTVQIGTQCWTQSNLKTSKYRNGDNISTGLSNSAWETTTSGAYAIYNNDPVNDGLYGKLYNHYAVTDSRGLCPTGWHVPTDAEWTTLENHLGGSSLAGGSLKSTAMQPTLGGWNPPNTGATNTSGFTALPGGLRNLNGNFSGTTDFGCWWSTSVLSGSFYWLRFLNYSSSFINPSYYGRAFGFSVRCLKD